ncbi:MAG: hypothetical protein OSJ45_03680 [Lachnospiraceae bacterium]|nr:hypothetical protein [Lachnospiraceae bacterium]
MDFLDELRELGVDVDKALKSLAGKTPLYEKLVKKFPGTVKQYSVSPDFNDNETDNAIEKTHALKGVAGNLSITPLYNGYSEVVKLLREGKPEQARESLRNLIPVQEDIIKCIENHM